MATNSGDKIAKAGQIGAEKHPRTDKKYIQYGTAGFRTRSEELDHVLYRMGLLAVLRSKAKAATIGMMITASHNPECDNGVKLVDPSGEMLQQSWEILATKLANVEDSEVSVILSDIIRSENIDFETPARILIGQDTRESSTALSKAAQAGVAALFGKINDYGIVSTPMLHYFVACENTKYAYGQPTETGYFDKLTKAFKKLRGKDAVNGSYKPSVVYDGANGVGALKMKVAQKLLGDFLIVSVYNDGTEGKLNYMCGADYVKSQQRGPHGVPISANARCVSIDGDADRIVYYYTDNNNAFHLLDGDRIATLVAGYLMELVRASKLNLELGLVQTAYANGNSTNYISKTLKVPVACVPTGVKFLHHKALDFDIGVYFEANGHGTVVFSNQASKTITDAAVNKSLSASERAAAERLKDLMDVINQTVGDAISDMLLVETVLHSRGWDIQRWEETYVDLPNRQLKVVVKDRRVIETTDAERQCTSPAGLQQEINKLVKNFASGRAFVRPSGTEDIVRIYAEADTQSNTDQLAALVAQAVYDMAGGVGEPPKTG